MFTKLKFINKTILINKDNVAYVENDKNDGTITIFFTGGAPIRLELPEKDINKILKHIII